MKIIGTGHYLPEMVLTNQALEEKVDTSHEWIVERTGIHARHVVTDETTVTMASVAALNTFNWDHEVVPRDVGLIIVATSTPDHFLPSVANEVLKHIGSKKAMAFDVNAACSGFTHILDIASSLMMVHKIKYALVIGSETMSNMVDWQDRNTCILFGDGAGALLLENDNEKPFIYQKCESIPDEDAVLTTGSIVSTHPILGDVIPKGARYLKMQGTEVFKFAVKTVHDEILKAMRKTKLRLDEIDYIILHQANQRISDYIAKKLKVDSEKFYSTIAKTGNTSAASIPIVLDEMNESALLKRGMKVLLVGFGAGLSYGTIVLEW